MPQPKKENPVNGISQEGAIHKNFDFHYHIKHHNMTINRELNEPSGSTYMTNLKFLTIFGHPKPISAYPGHI